MYHRSRGVLARCLITVAVEIAPAGPAAAQAFPTQYVRIVVPFTPGSQSDLLGRAYGEKLQTL